MSLPVCPECDGEGVVDLPMPSRYQEPCPDCGGSGVWFDPETPEHPFERVAGHLLGEYGPICRWCGLSEEEHNRLAVLDKEGTSVVSREGE